MSSCRWSGPFLVVLLVTGQGVVQPAKLLGKRAVSVLPSSSGSSSSSTSGMPDSFGFREFILRAGNDRVVDFPNGAPEATIAQIIPANLLNVRKRRMASLASQRVAVGRDRSVVSTDSDDMGASAQVDGRTRQNDPIKMGAASIEIHPSRTSMTFSIRGLPSGTSRATVVLLDLYPATRAPFPIICRGAGPVTVDEMSAAGRLDPAAQPKLYTADITACLTAAREAGMGEIRIDMALPSHERCLFAEAPFLVLQ